MFRVFTNLAGAFKNTMAFARHEGGNVESDFDKSTRLFESLLDNEVMAGNYHNVNAETAREAVQAFDRHVRAILDFGSGTYDEAQAHQMYDIEAKQVFAKINFFTDKGQGYAKEDYPKFWNFVGHCQEHHDTEPQKFSVLSKE